MLRKNCTLQHLKSRNPFGWQPNRYTATEGLGNQADPRIPPLPPGKMDEPVTRMGTGNCTTKTFFGSLLCGSGGGDGWQHNVMRGAWCHVPATATPYQS
jgi:hypothetical protein